MIVDPFDVLFEETLRTNKALNESLDSMSAELCRIEEDINEISNDFQRLSNKSRKLKKEIA